ncbi:MAG: septum site-determining protein MinD [Synergistaceae bacterium]|jgi:septum site-determining protein MinD|nr:septum site-determining protein MinD [Synergistaceae bacterium]
MAPRVIVVTSGKGGVGKTTTTANIATALAAIGNKVVAIDGDVGLRNLDFVMGLENRIVYTLIDALEGNCRLNQTLIRDKRIENLYMIPTAQSKTKDAVSSDQMVKVCNELKNDFDYIFIDSPAGIEAGFKNASAGAEEALVVTTPDVSAVRDADRIIGLLESMEKSPIRLIVNRIRPHMVKRGDMLGVSDVLDILAIDLIGMVPDDESVFTSSSRGEPLTLSSDTQAAIAFRNIASRITGKDVPFINLDEPHARGLIGFIKKAFGHGR